MRWADVDLDAKWWTLPESATKNRATHRVPFTDRVVELLKDAKADTPEESPWVFAGIRGGSVAARTHERRAVPPADDAGAVDGRRPCERPPTAPWKTPANTPASSTSSTRPSSWPVDLIVAVTMRNRLVSSATRSDNAPILN